MSTPSPVDWTPDNWIALAAIVAAAVTAVLVSAWSHRHDREMRQLEFDEQRKRRAEDRRDAWLGRAQELAADVRHALLTDLTPEQLTAGDAREAIRLSFDEELSTRFSLVSNFALDQSVRDAARNASNKLLIYLARAGTASRTPETSPRHPDALNRAHATYGEAHYALDQFVESLGGPPTPDRDSYFWALETDNAPNATDISTEAGPE